jgi:hypothetical protein
MKANPKFDGLTARWWKLTGRHVVELFSKARMYPGERGRWGDYSRTKRRELRELCSIRRDVHRAGTAI